MSSPTSGHSGPDRPPPDPSDQPLLLGDVVLCPAVAERQAADHAGAYDDEIALLIVHGMLHVLGHDHAEPAEASVMRGRERELLEALHWRGAVPEGFRQEQPLRLSPSSSRPRTSGRCSVSSCCCRASGTWRWLRRRSTACPRCGPGRWP